MNCDTNLQYDQFKSTQEVVTQYQKNQRRSNNNCLSNAKPRNKINMRS